jgi:hypothetical protein
MHAGKGWEAGERGGNHTRGGKFVMGKSQQIQFAIANAQSSCPSIRAEGSLLPSPHPSSRAEGRRSWPAQSRGIGSLLAGALATVLIVLVGCGQEAPKPGRPAENKPAEPVVPEDIQDAAKVLLGSEAKVLVFGDLANTGKQEFLAANVVPNTPKSTVAGLVITRAVLVENEDGKWVELLRCDEHLKNTKGYLGLTPLEPVTGWKLQYEQSAVKGLELYFTALQTNRDAHVLPIGIRWNPATKRYQSLDRNYEHFLGEAASLESTRSMLR